MSKHSNQKGNSFILGEYLIKQTIGKGTFGKVKLGIYLPTKEKVAIKILEKSKMVEEDDKERAAREMKIVQILKHENIVQIFEILETEDQFYIVMEYCENGELFNYIVENHRLSNDEAAFFYYQIINGLEYLHSKGVVHRDLKPENLLLSEGNIIKIIDFGLSNYFSKELLKTPCGSPCYASPEMVSGKRYNGFNIDIWSSGIILFAMICGFLPFEDKDHTVLFKTILECNVDYPRCVGPSAKDLLKKILVPDPELRIKIPEIKKHRFYLKGEKIYQMKFGLTMNSNISGQGEIIKDENEEKKLQLIQKEHQSAHKERHDRNDKGYWNTNDVDIESLGKSPYNLDERLLSLYSLNDDEGSIINKAESNKSELQSSSKPKSKKKHPFNLQNILSGMKNKTKEEQKKKSTSKNKTASNNSFHHNINSINSLKPNIKNIIFDEEVNFNYEPIQTEGNVKQNRPNNIFFIDELDRIERQNLMKQKKNRRYGQDKKESLSTPKPGIFYNKNSSPALLKRTTNAKLGLKGNKSKNHPKSGISQGRKEIKSQKMKNLNLSYLLTLNSMRFDKRKTPVKMNDHLQTDYNKITKAPVAYKTNINNNNINNISRKKTSLEGILFNNAIINFNMYEQKIYIPNHTEGNIPQNSKGKVRMKSSSQNKHKPTSSTKTHSSMNTNSIKIPLKKNLILFNNLPVSGINKKTHSNSKLLNKAFQNINYLNRSPKEYIKQRDKLPSNQLKYSYNVCHTEDNTVSKGIKDISYGSDNFKGNLNNSQNSIDENLKKNYIPINTNNNLKHHSHSRAQDKPLKTKTEEGIGGYIDYNHGYLKTEINVGHNNINTGIPIFLNKKSNEGIKKKPFKLQLQPYKNNLNIHNTTGHSLYTTGNVSNLGNNTELKKSILSKAVPTDNYYAAQKGNSHTGTKGKEFEKILMSIREQVKKKHKFILKDKTH
ncbi:MAG: serine/threonine-protein kinase [archaeon]|nr:serine/threonine-protein kinase [archaeon]